jgi:hypothetical protein
VDYPRGFSLPSDVKEQNDRLGHTYGVNALPTLLATDPDGHELGRIVGMPGADEVMAQLQDFARKGELASK